MVGWSVEFHKKAMEELEGLPESLQDKFDALFVRIRSGGFAALPRGSVKYIYDGIRELRVMGKDGTARSLYVTETGKIVRILVAFVKKTEKTPPDMIEIAKKRRREQA